MPADLRFPWLAATTVIAASVVTVAAWLRLPPETEPSAAGPVSGAGTSLPVLELKRREAATSTDVLAERLAAYDPTPLFLPPPAGRRTSAQVAAEVGLRAKADGPFADLEPELSFEQGGVARVKFPLAVSVPAGPAEGLRLSAREDLPLALDRRDTVPAPLPPRLGWLEAVAASGGQVVLALALPIPARGGPSESWQPFELTGVITPGGLAGSLGIVTSSGSEPMDAFFRDYLVRTLRIGERLPAGVYTFRLGP